MTAKGRYSRCLSIDREKSWIGYRINNIRLLTVGENTRRENERRIAYAAYMKLHGKPPPPEFFGAPNKPDSRAKPYVPPWNEDDTSEEPF